VAFPPAFGILIQGKGRQTPSEFAVLPLQSHGVITQCLAGEHLGTLGRVDPEDLISLR
jgi:hypothetical protein